MRSTESRVSSVIVTVETQRALIGRKQSLSVVTAQWAWSRDCFRPMRAVCVSTVTITLLVSSTMRALVRSF